MLGTIAALGLALALQHAQHSSDRGSRPVSTDSVPLYDNLGTHHYAVTTAAPRAQAYFDQGLRLYYAFNHVEAIRAFREAQRLDPTCAMCFWGEALAWGPNINMPMDSASAVAAYAAIQRAKAARHQANEREQALIDALAVRYAPLPPSNRAGLDSAYVRAMRSVVERYSDDQEAPVLYGEALMDLRPWNYWTDAEALEPGIADAVRRFERVIAANPKHPGACHFFIHAVEERQPERAIPCADRLAALMPGAGHLVHMPGHIYIRVGRYEDVIRLNEHAVHADESYIRDQRPAAGIYTAGYYPHNYDFLAFAASMIGREEQAIGAAHKVASLIPEEMLRVPGMTLLQQFITRPLQFQVRFERWDDVLKTPAPAEDLPHARGLWSYARGRALVATGDLRGAEAALADVRAASRTLAGVRLEFNPASTVLNIAEHVLAGHLAAARGDHEGAIAALREAVRYEDSLLYGEPPEWSVPVRQELGAALLAAGRAAEAERIFREDLERFPENGWSLSGLAQALDSQGKAREAAKVRQRFRAAFRSSTVNVLP